MHPFIRLFVAIVTLLALTGIGSAAVVDVGVAKDAQVASGYPTTNYGMSNNLYLQRSTTSFKDERAWMTFNLAGQLPPGAVITSAKLRLYCWKADTANDLPTAVHGSDSDSWGESSLTWNTQPSHGAVLSTVTLKKGEQGKWIEWDVTTYVKAQQTGDGTVTLVVKPVTEATTPTVSYAFDAREYSSSLAPRLRVEYSGTWPATGSFTIFHMNDVHSRLLPHELDIPEHGDSPVFEQVGGAAHFAGKLLELKAANPESLVLDAGDVSEGNPVGDLRGNGAMVDFYNLLDARLKTLGGRGIDAAAVGNHDVRSMVYVNNLKNNATYPVISMNVCRKGTQIPYFQPYVIVTVNGRKVGILGYTNDESSYMDADAAAEIEVVKAVWEDTNAATINIKDYVNELRTVQGCDVVVLLSHMGHSRIVAGADALIEDHGGVRPPEIVVSGHWHSYADNPWQPAHLNGKTLLVEAASYLQYLGELQVTGDGKYLQAAKHPIRTADIVPDASVQNLVDTLRAEYEATNPPYRLDQVIGHSAVHLRLDKDKWWTMNEFPWSGDNTAGGWISDAMVWKAGQLGFPSQLALQSGGGVRRDVPAGPITYAQIYETYPWQDDGMVKVQMTGQEIWNYIEGDYCGTSISKDWLVTANDGIISGITYQGSPVSLSGTYNVLISEYMAAHDTAFAGKTAIPVGGAIRQAVVDYTGQFGINNPMTVPGPRYNLDTELAGGFRAVVTMVDDKEGEPYNESIFVRLLSALPETVERRNAYGLAGLVNADGTINPAHQFSESMLYRSHLGFKDDAHKPGDIIEIWVEGGFHGGNPQLVDQEGINDAGGEMTVLGNDPALARPEYHPTIGSFWDEQHENHYVTFYATKTGTSTVRDSAGTTITLYQPGGYTAMPSLPGNVNSLLEISGVNTYEHTARRFRVASVVVASTTGFPPQSQVDPLTPSQVSSGPVAVTATAGDTSPGTVVSVDFYYRHSADGAAWGPWTLYQHDTSSPWSASFGLPAGPGTYEFYSVATDNDGNIEPSPVLADASVRYVPPTFTLTATVVNGTGGSITPESTAVPQGSPVSFTITPEAGYDLSGLTDNGVPATATPTGNGSYRYTLASVTENHSVQATFTPVAAPVPALGPWGLVACGAALAFLRRRRLF